MDYKIDYEWKNSIENQQVIAGRYYEPETLEHLIEIVTDAELNQKKVRAVGSGHSFNDIAVTEDYMIYPGKIDFLKTVAKDKLRLKWQDYLNNTNNENPDGYSFIEVGAGIVLKDLNRKLDADFGLALLNMGGIDHQTLSGVISTGTHGTGIHLSSFPGLVRSLVIVSEGGKVFQIEPTDGITDRAQFDESTGVELVQNDDDFYSVVLGLGSMGILYSVIIDVRPLYYLFESKELTTWSTVKADFISGKLFDPYPMKNKNNEDILCPLRGVMLQISPYKKNNDYTCIVVRHIELGPNFRRGLFERIRNPFSSLVDKYFEKRAYNRIIKQLTKNPEKTPNSIETSMKHLKDKKYINKSYKVLYQGFEYIKELAYDCEFAFNLKYKIECVQAIDDIMKIAKEFKDNKNLYQTSPLGVRFVSASKAYMAPEFEKSVCYIDVPFLLKSNGAAEMLDAYQEKLLVKGTPHWGKVNNVLEKYPELIPEKFPKITTWRKMLEKYNSKGTFDNKFITRLNLRGV